MFQFELHPHIGDIRTDILLYEKGLVVKHIKAPERVNVKLPDLWKNQFAFHCFTWKYLFPEHAFSNC